MFRKVVIFVFVIISLFGCKSPHSTHNDLSKRFIETQRGNINNKKDIHMAGNEKIELQQSIEHVINKLSQRPDLNARKLMNEPALANDAMQICEIAKDTGYISEQLLSLEIKILDYLAGNLRDFVKAKIFIDDIQAMIAKGIRIEKADLALFKTNQGFFQAVYYIDYEKASFFMKEALNLLSQTKENNEEKLRIIANLAQFAVLKGDDKRARFYIDKGTSLLKKSNSEVYKILFLYAHSIYLGNKAEFTKSLSIINEAAKYLPVTKDYPTFEFYVMRQKANILIKLARYKQASVIINELEQKIAKFFQNRSNSIIAANLVLQGIIKAEYEKNYEVSEKLILKAIDISKQFFRGDSKHLVQALEHLHLGQVLEHQEKYNEAIKEYLMCESIFKNFMTYLNIDDVSLLYYHLAMINIKINNIKDAHVYFKKHVNIFGEKHYRSMEIAEDERLQNLP